MGVFPVRWLSDNLCLANHFLRIWGTALAPLSLAAGWVEFSTGVEPGAGGGDSPGDMEEQRPGARCCGDRRAGRGAGRQGGLWKQG